MGLYAKRPAMLARQLFADLFVIAWAIAWWFVGRAVDATIRAVAGPSRQASTTARQLADQVGRTAEEAAKIPFVGEQLRSPLDQVKGSLGSLIATTDAQVATIEQAALLLGWLVFVIPVLGLVIIWLPVRVRFVLRAHAAQRFIDAQPDLDLFALRAMVVQPMHVIARISEDPVAAWRSGDRDVINALAAVELRRSGLRPPAAVVSPPP